jgi:3-hydroxyisobutyrate dehydrogenase-like beta-hydroxyacid dehydrogenase
MGISLAASTINSGHTAYWVSDGRSPATRKRAEEHGLVETGSIQELCDRCSVIVCVCPPHAAVDVAARVLSCSFGGIYADVNAISPERAREIGQMMANKNVEFVDGGIIGGPAWSAGTTALYLSGGSADGLAACFGGGPLETEVIGSEPGKASALKMCFAANTKGTAALLCAIVAAADKLGVRDALEKQWSRNDPAFAGRTLDMISGVTAKAWRFAGEMEEIASTFESAGLPRGFHDAAADVYRRIAGFKGADPLPETQEVIEFLLRQAGDEAT